jgi:hypothetical protein
MSDSHINKVHSQVYEHERRWSHARHSGHMLLRVKVGALVSKHDQRITRKEMKQKQNCAHLTCFAAARAKKATLPTSAATQEG